MTDEFKALSKEFVCWRMEHDRDDLGARRFHGRVYPTVRILDEKGAIVWAPDARTVNAFEEAFLVAKKRQASYSSALAKADLTKSEVRADYVSKHVARSDGDSAIELYAGFDRKDASDARFQSLVKLVTYLTDVGRDDASTKLLDDAESVFDEERRDELTRLRLEVFVLKLKLAYSARNKLVCYRILDDLALRYPESELGKRHDSLKQWIDSHIASGATLEFGARNFGGGNRRRQRGQQQPQQPQPQQPEQDQPQGGSPIPR